MSEEIEHKKFSCPKCGVHYEANPPDDKHRFATMVQGETKKDHITIKYTCKSCGNTNILYWTHPQFDPAYHVQ